VLIGWEDVPHLSAEEKARLEAALAPHEKEARMRGIPSIGSGAIYPVPESDIVCKPFEIPRQDGIRHFSMSAGVVSGYKTAETRDPNCAPPLL
jgi:hypothetical protein